MAKKVLLECKKCTKETEHWDNRETKRGKQPDYKCCDCGAGIWINAKTKVSPKAVVKKEYTGTTTTDYSNRVPQSMFGRWAIDASVAALVNKLDKEEVLKTFEFFLAGVNKALNGSTTATQTAEVSEKEVVAEVKESVEIDDEFGDLDL